MKSRRYIQLPLSIFRTLFPEQSEQIPPIFDESDPRYIVRYDYTRGIIEVGYEEDTWRIR